MPEIYQLNLPHPSNEFLQTIKDLVCNSLLDAPGKLWMDQQNNVTNSALYSFFKDSVIDQLISKEFGSFFNVPVSGVVGIMKNADSEHANHPPHIDSRRSLAINYYVELGGNSVATTFYDLAESTAPKQSQNYTYQQVQDLRMGSVQFAQGSWYAYDVCRCHSIENITDTRYFVSILIDDPAFTVRDFLAQYPKLISDKIQLYK
jgi:hypothetical protein